MFLNVFPNTFCIFHKTPSVSNGKPLGTTTEPTPTIVSNIGSPILTLGENPSAVRYWPVGTRFFNNKKSRRPYKTVMSFIVFFVVGVGGAVL